MSARDILAEIAELDTSFSVRRRAVERSADVRFGAVDRISDQALLAEIAKSDTSERVHREAIERITDQTLLADVLMPEREFHLQKAIVDRITKQSLLAKIARSHGDVSTRLYAESRLLNRPPTVGAAFSGSLLLCALLAGGHFVTTLLFRYSCKLVIGSSPTYWAAYGTLVAWSCLVVGIHFCARASIDFYVLADNVRPFYSVLSIAGFFLLSWLISRRCSVALLKACYVAGLFLGVSVMLGSGVWLAARLAGGPG